MILVPASDCLQHKLGANRLNGRNLNVRTVEVQLNSVAETKLPGIKIDNCFLNNAIEYKKATSPFEKNRYISVTESLEVCFTTHLSS